MKRFAGGHLVAFFLWIVTVGLALLDVLYGRAVIMAVAELMSLNDWGLSFIDRASVLVLGLAGLSLAIFCDYYYRRGVAQGNLWPRFTRIAAVQVAVILAGLAVGLL